MSSSRTIDLVADIGGTNARFALSLDGRLGKVESRRCAEYPSLSAALRGFLDRHSDLRPMRAVVAIAGPIEDQQVDMTNHPWSLSAAALRRELGLDQVQLINDFAAVALSIPVLRRSDLEPVKSGTARKTSPVAVLGPGTGLGVAALVPHGSSWIPVTTEGGHRDLAATTEREWQIVSLLRERFGRVSVERVVSGPGLVHLYEAITRLAGALAEPLEPRDVVAQALADSSPACVEATALFSSWLGAVAGDLALTLGAHGGVYLAGGVLGKMGRAFDAERFRRRFLAKGRCRHYVESIPVDAVVHPYPALLGASRALELASATLQRRLRSTTALGAGQRDLKRE